MKIISYNINGVRAAIKKGFADWLKSASPDVLCLQEIKALPENLPENFFKDLGYAHEFWMPAEKKGYSGVGIFTKSKPDEIVYGCENECYDREGRFISAKFGDISILNVYLPSGSSGDVRQDFKMEFLDFFFVYVNELRKKEPNLVICGDFNICHKPIDIHNPVSNKKSSGFLPEEREWLSKFIDSGFTDTFRHFNAEPHQYTWWTYRLNARDRNLGWRIDYHFTTKNLDDRLKRSVILKEARHSDHCPILLEIV